MEHNQHPERVEMDVAHQLGKITVAVAYDGFVTVLKKMPMPAMAQIVAHRVAGQKAPHEFRQPVRSTAQKYMGVVAHQRPGVNRCQGFARELA